MATKKKVAAVEPEEEAAAEPKVAKKAKGPDLEALAEGSDFWQEFRNVTYVKAHQQDDGSYVVVGQRGDTWIVDEHDFHRNYKPATPNKS